MTATAIQDETEKLRQLVIAARQSLEVEPDAEKCLTKLNTMYSKHPELFSEEDVRFVNVLRGTLAVRLESHRKGGPYARIPKAKGEKLDHCWRCETPTDTRFTEICPVCDSKARHFRICPVCRACGCQQARKVLV
jgi:hypothetical protein